MQEDLELLWNEVLGGLESSRYLAAYNALLKIDEIALKCNDSSIVGLIHKQLLEHEEKIKLLRERHAEVITTLHFEDNSSDWILGNEQNGVLTYYKYNSKTNSLTVKLQGTMEDVSILEQVAVAHEVDLFSLWVPFCNQAVLIDTIHNAEIVYYLSISVLSIMRDVALHCYGADCLTECNKLLILGKSIGHYAKPIPFKAKSWFQDQLTIRHFQTIVEVLTPGSARTTIVADIDPHCPLPQALLNYCIQQVAGKVLFYFQKQALKITKEKDSEYGKRIRENKEFYSYWLLPKLRKLYESKGWTAPTLPSTILHPTPPSSFSLPSLSVSSPSPLPPDLPSPTSRILIRNKTLKKSYVNLVQKLKEEDGLEISTEDLNFDCLYIC